MHERVLREGREERELRELRAAVLAEADAIRYCKVANGIGVARRLYAAVSGAQKTRWAGSE